MQVGIGINFSTTEEPLMPNTQVPSPKKSIVLSTKATADAESLTPHMVLTATILSCMQEFLTQHNDAAGDAHASTAAAAAASEAAAVAAENGQLSEPLSLWHEMQKRQQAEEAALESELSTGPGLQGPGGIFGEDLWMFDGGLFAEEGGCVGTAAPICRACAVLHGMFSGALVGHN